MERREAPASSKRGRGKRNDWCAARCSIPSTFEGGKETKTAYPAPQRIRAAERWLCARSVGPRLVLIDRHEVPLNDLAVSTLGRNLAAMICRFSGLNLRSAFIAGLALALPITLATAQDRPVYLA